MFYHEYEFHKTEKGELPFFFHHDTILPNTKDALRRHWHPNIEILLVTHGGGLAHSAGEKISFSVGDILIFNSGYTHSIDTYQEETRYYCLIPHREFCLDNELDTDLLSFPLRIRDKEATAYYRKFIDLFDSDHPYRRAGTCVALLNLLFHLTCHFAAAQPLSEKNPSSNEGIRVAIAYLRAHSQEKLTLDSLSHEAGMNKYHFARSFKKITGDSPIAFLHRTRCENAKALLLHSEASLPEISASVGFSDLSYFCKIFHRYVGCSPGSYRKQFQCCPEPTENGVGESYTPQNHATQNFYPYTGGRRMKVYDAIHHRRSIRKFEQKPIPQEALLRLVDSARVAPYPVNLQPLKFALIQEEEKRNAIFPATRWAGYLEDGAPKIEERPMAYLALLGDISLKPGGDFSVEKGIAGATITLAAMEEGLGSCWLGALDRDTITQILDLPSHLELLDLIALGYPMQQSEVVPLRDGSVKYYLNESGTLQVPKRDLQEILL